MNNLYLNDAYLKEQKTIVEQQRVVKKKTAVVLKDNIFYPSGGGQIFDTGNLVVENKTIFVTRIVKIDGYSWLCLDTKDNLPEGTDVMSEIDWERRYRFMKSHTAAHLVMGAIKRNVADYSPEGIEINEECNIELRFAGDWDASEQSANNVIQISNETINKNLSVYAEDFSDINNAVGKHQHIFRGSTNFSGNIRIVVIEDWDANPCGGTHVKNTNELSEIELVEFSKHTFIVRLK